MPVDTTRAFVPVRIAVLTVSDTRGLAEDRSGDTLVARIESAGHILADRGIVRDDIDVIVARLHAWIDDPAIDCVITTGGTGVTGRDITPEAVERVAKKLAEKFDVPVLTPGEDAQRRVDDRDADGVEDHRGRRARCRSMRRSDGGPKPNRSYRVRAPGTALS